MARTLPESVARLKCEFEADAHTRKLPFARAIGTCTYGRRAAIAARLQRSGSLLQAWADPEAANIPPNQKLAELILAALVEGVPTHEALEVLVHLNSIFGLETALTVEVLGTVGVDNALATVLREFGEAAARVTELKADGIDGFDRVRIRREISDVRVALDQLEADVAAAEQRRRVPTK